jgi:hypothetical protein
MNVYFSNIIEVTNTTVCAANVFAGAGYPAAKLPGRGTSYHDHRGDTRIAFMSSNPRCY